MVILKTIIIKENISNSHQRPARHAHKMMQGKKSVQDLLTRFLKKKILQHF